MAKAYTPGLKITQRLTHRVRRVLPIAGEVIVKQGDRVDAQDVVAETFMPGDITPLNLSKTLSIPPADLADCLLKTEGDTVEIGDPLAITKGIFGFFKTEYQSKTVGTIESISNVTGQLIIRGAPLPVQVQAFLSGQVVEVIPNEGVIIESDVSFVQGIFGIGGEAFGPIKMACSDPTQELTEELILPEMKGTIVVGGARMSEAAVKKAVSIGVAGIISGGMDDQDLKSILGYDLGVAITGSERIGLSLMITEGFGSIAMAQRTFELLESREGDAAAITGTTQIRAGVMRPEVLIPLNETEKQQVGEDVHSAGVLDIGVPIRIIRDPYFGELGTVAELPSDPQVLGSGSKARVLLVKCESGETVTVPRANVELVEN